MPRIAFAFSVALLIAGWMGGLSIPAQGAAMASTRIPSTPRATQSERVPATVLEEIEKSQRAGRRVQLLAAQMPKLPKIGPREYISESGGAGDNKTEKFTERIAIALDSLGFQLDREVPGFTFRSKESAPDDPYPHRSDWTCASDFAINLWIATTLWEVLYPQGGEVYQARVHRPQRVAEKQRNATKRRLQALQKPLLYNFFSCRMTDPATYGKEKPREITGTWGRYVHRIDLTKQKPFAWYFAGTPAALKSIAPATRAVWVELSVRVDKNGRPIKRPPPFARLIALETASALYLVEQRAATATSAMGGSSTNYIDIGDW